LGGHQSRVGNRVAHRVVLRKRRWATTSPTLRSHQPFLTSLTSASTTLSSFGPEEAPAEASAPGAAASPAACCAAYICSPSFWLAVISALVLASIASLSSDLR